jgi:hypothetical protein
MTNLEEINLFVENRASRSEDLEEIEQLRIKLKKKGKEYEGLAEELKFFRLELENKEETYNKIFVPSKNNEHLGLRRKDFKLRRQGRSITTVRDNLLSLNSANIAEKRSVPCKAKIL